MSMFLRIPYDEISQANKAFTVLEEELSKYFDWEIGTFAVYLAIQKNVDEMCYVVEIPDCYIHSDDIYHLECELNEFVNFLNESSEKENETN